MIPTPDFILGHVALNAVIILASYGLTQDGMPFYFVRRFFDSFLLKWCGTPRTIYFPILYCVYCMPSLWGFVYFMLAIYQGPWDIPYLILHILCVWALVKFAHDTQNS